MKKQIVWTLRAMVLSMAVFGLMATSAQASLINPPISGEDLPPGNPASELAFVQATVGDTELVLLDGSLLTVTGINDPTGTVAWDLTGEDLEAWYVLVVDGAGSNPPLQIYNLYAVSEDQRTSSFGAQAISCCFTFTRDISHVTFIGKPADGELPGVPEPATLLLLGGGLVTATLLRRKTR